MNDLGIRKIIKELMNDFLKLEVYHMIFTGLCVIHWTANSEYMILEPCFII